MEFLIREVDRSNLVKEAKDEIIRSIEENFDKYPEVVVSPDQKTLIDSLKVIRETEGGDGKVDSTDLLLQVSSSTGTNLDSWSRQRIVEALVNETGISQFEANDIAIAVEKKVFASDINIISVSLIRELVDHELFIRGFNKKLEKQNILGMSTFNINKIIFASSKENSNVVSNNPEAVNLAIAENTLKQYALKEIFTSDVSKAHMDGAVHLHDLGYPVRVYCSAHSLEFIKKFGLKLGNLSTESRPAKHAQTLTGHLNTFLASMQAYYAGALGIGYVNIFYAPYLVGMDYDRMKQEAQYLIFSCSQNAFSRGGQTLFIDFNIHTGIPKYMRDIPAIGPGGNYTGKTYKDYEKEAQMFAKALMDVWREGDSNGTPFPFPKFDFHLNQETFDDPDQRSLLEYACLIASENGSTYFIFDRDEVTLSACCRLRTQITDNVMLTNPESMRFCGFQNVTINLPQASYKAKGDYDKTIEEIMNSMEIAMKAHLQKKEFITKLMEKPGAPLWEIGKLAPDGRPYVDLEEATYIVGMIGLNETVKNITGKALHEDEDAYRMGLKIISTMYLKAKEFQNKYGLKVTLEESPAESASLRFAKVDMQKYPDYATDLVRGDKESGQVYYTNSIHLEADAPVDIIERIEKQGKFNSLIESGAITHIFLGEQRPDPRAVFNLVEKTWLNTQSAQIVLSPEFTVCKDCNSVTPGYQRNVVNHNHDHHQKEDENNVEEIENE
ncbi:anaerobic ribonucleoside-triphosphate reductase [Candidatus Woesearchaeota archaeon]|nr:MAG: anaerobic ribonucleoside-triphosphate reductase [Candidatus Woesearchaeota archaeon]